MKKIGGEEFKKKYLSDLIVDLRLRRHLDRGRHKFPEYNGERMGRLDLEGHFFLKETVDCIVAHREELGVSGIEEVSGRMVVSFVDGTDICTYSMDMFPSAYGYRNGNSS